MQEFFYFFFGGWGGGGGCWFLLLNKFDLSVYTFQLLEYFNYSSLLSHTSITGKSSLKASNKGSRANLINPIWEEDLVTLSLSMNGATGKPSSFSMSLCKITHRKFLVALTTDWIHDNNLIVHWWKKQN